MQKLILILLVWISISNYCVNSQFWRDAFRKRGRGRGRGRGRWKGRSGDGYMSRGDQSFTCSSCDVIACSLADSGGKVLEERKCPDSYTCTNGPLKVFIKEKDYYFRFCNVPFSPELSQSCKHGFQWWGSDYFYTSGYVKACPEGESCEAGPVDKMIGSTRYRLYFCGNSTPSEPNYKEALTKASCHIDSHVTRDCGWWNRCDSSTLTLQSQSSNVTLGFCSMSQLLYLELFGKPCREMYHYWDPPPVVKHGTPGEENTTQEVPTTLKPANTTEAGVDTGGSDLPDTGVQAPGDDNLP